MYTKFENERVEGHVILNEETGEIHDLYQRRKVNLNEFMIVFLGTIDDLCKLKGSELKVLMACWKYCTFNPKGTDEFNRIYANKNFKLKLIEMGCGSSLGAIDVALNGIIKGKFLKRVGTKGSSEYILNPKYFFKGQPKDASRLTLEFLHEPNEEV